MGCYILPVSSGAEGTYFCILGKTAKWRASHPTSDGLMSFFNSSLSLVGSPSNAHSRELITQRGGSVFVLGRGVSTESVWYVSGGCRSFDLEAQQQWKQQ